ncbi:MAG: diguanylate cyclase [Deltaproteobacteria bacterium]|nr:diguanylate cyclase [Deltaproteobacteria bacterium]
MLDYNKTEGSIIKDLPARRGLANEPEIRPGSDGYQRKWLSPDPSNPGGYFFLLLSWRFLAVNAAIFCLWVIAAWYISWALAENRLTQLIVREQLEADKTARVVSAIIERSLSHVRNIPTIIASEPKTISLLSRFGPDVTPSPLPYAERHRIWLADPELRDFGERLSQIVGINDLGINACWLMNAAGDSVAVGVSPKEMNYTGANYTDREYFKSARRGQNGRQFAVGRVTGVPGLFFISPVIKDGQFLGAVGVRTNLDSLIELLAPNTFLSDENDVIILARDSQLLMRALPGARVERLSAAARESRYKRKEFNPLSITPSKDFGAGNLFNWLDQPFPSVFAVHPSLINLLNIHAYRFLGGMADIERDRLSVFALLFVTGFLLISFVTGSVVFVKTNREHRRTLLSINEKLARQARTDSLTGCANRRYFMEVLAEERQRNARYGNPFCILSIDLDHFKQINDRYGHPIGDQTLRHFAAVVQGILRPTDFLGRMGGEEFCILLPQTEADAASAVAERIRATIEASPPLVEQTMIHFTISVGIAQWQMNTDKIEDDILRRADNALYEAKNAGRNTVRQG